VSGWRWPCASSNHISAPPKTLTKAMRVADDLVLVILHFFWKGSVLIGNPGKAGTSDEGQDGFQELHSLYVGVCYFSICAVRFKSDNAR